MKKVVISLAIFTLIFLITLAFVYIDQWQPRVLDEPVAFSISHGQSLSEISLSLKENGLIKSRSLFEMYGKYKGYDRKISEGIHYLHSTGIETIYKQIMSSGQAKERITITIPEGFTVEKIAQKLGEAGVVNADEFLAIAKTGEGIDESLLKNIPTVEGTKYRLEGYYFPDTYYFQPNMDVITVSERMIEQFFSVINSFEVKPDLPIHEWVTLASIVEREAVLQEERGLIAGVFFNRLKEKWKLQACATVLYAIGKPKDRLLYKDLEIESPYNTYLSPGLPVGPIASPGKESLLAVVHPIDHNFFYYVVKGDGSGGHNFSETYSQHNDYKAEALKQH
ncbi:hypothetical protein CIB95_13330 [Lottiidibacillus patelloidae]|uniref:Endolytic murein transglycosylase n=1 Tax=Lottiidibacillus patelloidae TaxID=2670334 RepID=A0A263BQV9_9BACI|nr:endolytic transglycosylase MltG [Lottiidibacillus patelloidae]OZM56085.1 hypothetical protein CIB95_13330 [Lottiidibacillus patelloidae]